MSSSISARMADMENTSCPATKKRRLALSKSIELQGINFLSLPEDIVSRITTEMPLKEAVRMSAVCSNLRRSWIYHRNLDFDILALRGSGTKAKRNQSSGQHNRRLDIKSFIGTVNSVLREHSGFTVNRLAITFGLHKKHANDIDGWVSFAIASKARVVVLNFSPYRGHYKNNYSFPCHLFNNQNSSHLQVLRLGSVKLDPSHDFCGFANLTTLALENVFILQDLQYLLLKCPALEWLSIRRCPQLHNLHVAEPLPQLNFLCVQDCAINKIDLHAPNLTAFQYRGASKVPFPLKECLKLKKANIAFIVEDNLEYIFTGLPNGLPHVETLHVEVYSLRAQIHGFTQAPLKFMYLRHLSMKITVEDKNAVFQLAYLLDAAPFLVDFHLDMMCTSRCSGRPKQVMITDHPHHNLKQACITGFNGNGGQVALVKYILRNAVQLERMVIDPKRIILNEVVDFYGVISAQELLRKYRKGVLTVVEHH